MDRLFSRKDVVGVLLITASVFSFISLFGYSSIDPSFNTSMNTGNVVSNFGGLVGAYYSDLLLQLFGIPAFIIPLAMAGIALMLFTLPKKRQVSYLRLASMALLLFFMSVCVDIIFGDVSYGGAVLASGGMTGRLVARFFSVYISYAGTFVLSLALSMLLFFYIFNISISVGFVVTLYLLYKAVSFPVMTLRLLLRNLARVSKYIHAKLMYAKTLRDRETAADRDIPVRVKRKRAEVRAEVPEDDFEEDDLDIEPVVRKRNGRYILPSAALLSRPPKNRNFTDADELKSTVLALQNRLRDFGVDGEVVEASPGPVITMYEFKPAPGVKINKVANLSDDLALALGCGSVRVIAPIPGKSVIGIEVPNRYRETVFVRELFDSKLFKTAENIIPVAVGKDTEGEPYVTDLARMPHLLVAGATGSGKSVFINTLICSLLYRFNPEQVRMIMVDPKMLELSVYDGIPHLLLPVVTEAQKAAQALKWAVREMTNRYSLLSSTGCRSIESYNKSAQEPLPYIVIIIDELADLMMVSSRDVEASITRLAQMARAAGIHLVLATQRPSVDVITGLIKANFPARIAFKVSSRVDARTIMDSQGAEKLLGMGDMLLLPPGTARLERLHGAFISDEEVKKVVDFVKTQGTPEYKNDILEETRQESEDSDYDPLYDEAVNIVVESGRASISFVQRKLKIGYNRAARIIETMENEGVVSNQSPSGQREVLVDR
ncbi:MAG: DNA translocase FtsK 4TM domain-containing protein [Oligoflexia bacterium]|nr:DNA translocase FtsK 4TM domain-containing protein [Oligoflexia bacterium]